MPPVVALTNGCFDLFHAGHAALLDWACGLADRIIVAVDDDRAVRMLKGSGRPVVALEHRLAVLELVPWIETQVFDGDVPALIHRIQPDLYFKGPDPGRKKGLPLPFAQHVLRHGGAVRQMPPHLCPPIHTTEIIARCKKVKV